VNERVNEVFIKWETQKNTCLNDINLQDKMCCENTFICHEFLIVIFILFSNVI
jgi:hypothetical protein